ncbi:MAG: hypothetical protein V1690_00510 [Candidatus Moraniibacteriota bacterium]
MPKKKKGLDITNNIQTLIAHLTNKLVRLLIGVLRFERDDDKRLFLAYHLGQPLS